MRIRIIQKLIDKIRNKKVVTRHNKEVSFLNRICSDEEIKYYKYNGWQSKGSGEVYDNEIDRIFFNKILKNYFLEYIKSTDKVLDIGAGTGRLSFALADYGCEVVAADISQDMLEQIDKNKNENQKITTIIANCEKLPFMDKEFDSVVSLDAMVHFVDWKKFLKEQSRVVKDGGIIAFNIYNGEALKRISIEPKESTQYITNGDYYASATTEDIENVCAENNFELLKILPYNFLYQTTLACGILESNELIDYGSYYYKLLKNQEFLDVIAEFENNYVKNMNPNLCSNIILIFKKK